MNSLGIKDIMKTIESIGPLFEKISEERSKHRLYLANGASFQIGQWD